MQKTISAFFTVVLFTMLVGCGGSSVDLPDEVLTDEAYAIQWTDFKAIEPDDGVKLLGGMADDMSDDQAKARLWLSAEADDIDGKYRERWEAFTDVGCQGMLTVYYRNVTTEGEGDNKRKVVKYQKHTFLKAKKGVKSKDLEDALDEFAEDDDNKKLEFEAVDDADGWFWLTRDGDEVLKMPADADEDTAEAFKKLLKEAGDAPTVTAWRMIDEIGEEIDEELKREGLSDEREDELKRAKSTKSIVMACTPGKSAKTSLVITFEDGKQADGYADDFNAELLEKRAGLKRGMINAENPPHPSVIDDLFDDLMVKTSGKEVSLEISRGSLEDMLNILASMLGSGGDATSPRSMLEVDPMLNVPPAYQVPGVRSCYDQLEFGASKLPQ